MSLHSTPCSYMAKSNSSFCCAGFARAHGVCMLCGWVWVYNHTQWKWTTAAATSALSLDYHARSRCWCCCFAMAIMCRPSPWFTIVMLPCRNASSRVYNRTCIACHTSLLELISVYSEREVDLRTTWPATRNVTCDAITHRCIIYIHIYMYICMCVCVCACMW